MCRAEHRVVSGVKVNMRLRENIWILEDDPGAVFVYGEMLGASYDIANFTKLSGLRDALEGDTPWPDLLIADLQLPDGSFLDLLRGQHLLDGLPYLVVSSSDDLKTLQECFHHNATDYLTKPFSHNELRFKIERILTDQKERNRRAPISIDARSFTVHVEGHAAVTLTGKEFQIISMLVNAENMAVPRGELISKIWGEVDTSAKTLDVHLHNIRRKLQPLGLLIVHQRPNCYALVRSAPILAR